MDISIELKVPERLVPGFMELLPPLGVTFRGGKLSGGILEAKANVCCENLAIVTSLLKDEDIEVMPI